MNLRVFATPIPYLFLLIMATAAGTLVGCGDDSPTAPSEGGIVRGQVLGPGDQGIANALLTLEADGEPTRTITTDDEGRFVIEGVPPGEYTLVMDPPLGWIRAAAEPGARTVSITAGGASEFIFRLAPAEGEGELSGFISHAGRGVAEVHVIVRGPGGEEHEFVTEDDGIFTFLGLSPGPRTIEVIPPPWFKLDVPPPLIKPITVPSFGRSVLNVELIPYTPQTEFAIEIEETGDFFPPDATVAPGTRVIWINRDAHDHTVTPDGHGAWERRALSQDDEEFEVVLNNPGIYEYFCEVHGDRAVVRVESEAPAP